ncbi:MAG: hypothetical protein Q9195_007693 [Heterodermia aff. obscurata]
MDPISLAASLAALIQLTTQAAQLLKGIKSGSAERVRLREEIRSTICLLQMLQDRVDDAELVEKDLASIRSLVFPGGPIDLLSDALEELIKKLSSSDRVTRLAQGLLWPFRKEEVIDLINLIERQKAAFSLAIQNDNIGLSLAIKAQVTEMSDQMTTMELRNEDIHGTILDERNQKILTWLSPITFGARQQDIIRARTENTGIWLLESTKFHSWKSGSNKVLWCHGIPGAGKTVLAAIVVDYLQRMRHDKVSAVAYIYCNYKERAQQTPNDLISSLVRHLVEQERSVPSDLVSLYQRHTRSNTRPSNSELQRLLVSTASRFPSFFIVIDALDECSETSRSALGSSLPSILPGAQILYTSRRLNDIERIFEGCHRLEIRASDSDIRRYIFDRILHEPRLARHIEADSNLKEVISDVIVRKSDGMFLLAQLHLGTIATKHSRKALKLALQTLPVELNRTYEDAMQRIDDQSKEDSSLARDVLLWVSQALNPLTLKELQHALAAMNLAEDKELDQEDLPDSQIVISVCAGLVTLDVESDAVRLVHYTTQDYFERNPLRPPMVAQEDIAKACLAYLSLESFSQGPCDDNDELRLRFQRYPFLRYAAVNWGNHARGFSEDTCKEDIINYLSKEQLVTSGRQASSVHGIGEDISGATLWYLSYRTNVSMLSTAASLGLTRIVNCLIDSGHDIESTDNAGATALIRAANNGHTDTIKILVAAGADIDRADVRGFTALIEATTEGHKETVTALLQCHPNIEARTVDGESALYYAVFLGHQSIAELLLNNGAKIEAESNLLNVALQGGGAAMIEYIKSMTDKSSNIDDIKSSLLVYLSNYGRSRSVEMISMLLKEGADLTYSFHGGNTPIHVAAQKGLIDPVDFLLSQGVDPNLRTADGYTPLHWASFRGSLEVIGLLLRGGADITAQNDAGETALHTCMNYAQHEEAIANLLAQGAPVAMTDCRGRTALHDAARKGFKYNVQSLLHHGADIDAKDLQGWTPLQHAAAAGHDDVVQQLLERKPNLGLPSYQSLLDSARLRNAIKEKDIPLVQRLLREESISVDSTSPSGRTSLHYAAQNGLGEIARALIQRGASVSARIPDSTYLNWVTYLGHIPHEAYECAWITPLHNAAGHGHAEVAEILLSSGADLNATGCQGYTPFSVAVHAGHTDVVKILLDHGADVHRKDAPNRPSHLYWAVRKDFEDIVRLLLEHGADEERHTKNIKAALAIAVEHQSTGIVALMKSYGFTTGEH